MVVTLIATFCFSSFALPLVCWPECSDDNGDFLCDFCDRLLRKIEFKFENDINGKKDIVYLGDIQEELSIVPNTTTPSKYVSIPRLEEYFSSKDNLDDLRFIVFNLVWFNVYNEYTVISEDCIIDYFSTPQLSGVYNCGFRFVYDRQHNIRIGFNESFSEKYSYTNYDTDSLKSGELSLSDLGQYALMATVYYSPYSPYISDDEIIANENIIVENEALKTENQTLTEQNNNLSAENSSLQSSNQDLTEQNNNLQSSNQTLTEQNNNLSAENSSLQSSNQGLTEQNNNLTNRNQQLEAEKQSLAEQNNTLNNKNSALQAEVDTITQQRDDAREGLSNSNAVLNFFQGIYEAVNGVLQTFFNLDVFGFNLGSIIAIFVIAVVVLFVIKLFI